MQLKQYTRFQVDFESKWITAFGALTGLSFFLRIVYYFGLMSLRDVSIIELLTSALMGIILCGIVVCMNCLHMNAPGLYGLIGAAQCLLLIILSFTTGSPLRIILAIIWYALTALVLLATVGGYLPGRLLAALMFALPGVVRLLFFDLGKLGIIKWFRELGVLSILAAFVCFAMGLKPASDKK